VGSILALAIADLDGDGAAEIAFAISSSPASGTDDVVAYEHQADQWPAVGTTWPTFQWSLTNLEEDGSVPPDPHPWLEGNTLRAGTPGSAGPRLELRVDITDACVADCAYGPIRVAVQMENASEVALPAGAVVGIYAEDSAGDLTRVAGYGLPEIPAASAPAAFEIAVPPGLTDLVAFKARVDDLAAVPECDDHDNEAWRSISCP
jgi:hypothetical protein